MSQVLKQHSSLPVSPTKIVILHELLLPPHHCQEWAIMCITILRYTEFEKSLSPVNLKAPF